MNKTLEEVNSLIEDFKEKRTKLVSTLRGEFSSLFAGVFDKYPEIEAFKWNQYTPYFNDGDECTFGVHECYEAKKVGEEEFEDYYKDDSVKDFEAIKSKIDYDIMRELFGDHVSVIVYRNNVVVEDCEHD